MPSIQSILSRIPDGFKQLASLGLGACILVCLVQGHGVGLYYILRLSVRSEQHLLLGRPHPLRAVSWFGMVVFLMLSLHITEILVWAFSLVHLGLIARVHDAIYFCANAYTTLGYGTVALEPRWRDIGPIIAISGLFTFAWTTSTLVGVVKNQRELIAQLEDKRSRQRELRANTRKAERDARATERAAATARELHAYKQNTGLYLLGQFRGWKQDRREEEELWMAERIKRIGRKESPDENEPIPTKLPAHSELEK